MATVKGLCPHCQIKRVDRRIFPVNPEASTCFCPVCMKEIEPKVAIEGYKELINKMLLTADNTLFVTCDPVLAYSQYASVIELEPKEAHALLGRILCLIYMGKVRKSFLKEAYTLLENTPYEGCNIDEFVFFLKKINFALDEYETVVNKKLTFKNYYYDLDCLTLYWTHLTGIVKIKEMILEIVKSIKKTLRSSQQIEVLINMLEHNIDEKQKILHLDTYVVSGHCYRYLKFAYGKVTVSEVSNKKIDTKLSRYRLSTLDPNEKHKKQIKDEVFKDYTKTVKAEKASLGLAIFFYLIMAGFVTSAVLFFANKILFFSFVGAAGLLFLGATILLILHLSWRALLKKRKLRID